MSTPDENERSTRELVRYGAIIVLAGILVAFVVDNTQSVRVGFVFFERNPSLIWVLLFTALIGALLDRLFRWRRGR